MMGRSKAVTKWSILCSTIALVSFLALTGESARTQVTNPLATQRVSVRSDGGQANSASNGPVISGDCACVAFYSDASNLIPQTQSNSDTNAVRDVFLYDRDDLTVERVSVNSAGEQANGPSQLQGFRPAIDETCTCVAFSSDATNLVLDDTNGRTDVFVRDLSIPETFRASAGSLGEPNGASSFPSVSADCGQIAFQSNASNLVEDDNNQTSDIFVYGRESGTITRVNLGPGGEEANGASITPAISADGRCVAFASAATNLWPDDTNGTLDVYVACDGVVTCRASVDNMGNGGNDVSFLPAISADGQIVAFKSNASNLVPGDTNGVADIFVHDCGSGITERASVSSNGMQGDDIAIPPSISADGRYVAFGSYASNLIAGQSPRGRSQVYVRDRQTGVTSLVGTTPEGKPGNNSVPDLPPSISLNGEWVAFASLASDLVPGDTNQALDVFVRGNVPATPTPTPVVSASPTQEPIPCTRDTDCPFGQFCIDEMCVVATPTPRTPCEDDEDCPEGLFCIDDFCTDISTPTPTPPPCMMDEDCPEGSHCRAMVCVPIRECDDSDPELDRVNCRGVRETCVDGACECGGDCNLNGIVSGGELRIMVNIFGGARDVADCRAGDFNQDGQIFGSELRQAVRNLGLGCPGEGAPLIFGLNRTDEPRTIEISDEAGVPGQFVGVTVSLDGGGDVGVTNLDVLFDTNVLEFDLTDPGSRCAIDPRFDGTDTVLEVFAPQTPPTPEGQGRLRLLIWDMMFPGTAYDDGPLATCTFRIRVDAPLGTVPVNGERLEVADLDGNVFGATLIAGSVTVGDGPIPCDSSADCPDGLICGPDGMCIPSPPCMNDGDCPPGHVCGENDICVPVPCETDEDCPLGSVCGEDDVCVPIPCTSDDDCPPGTSCGDDGFCEPMGCMTDADCPLGSQCGEDGICTPIGCMDDEDCPPGSECGEDDTCVPLPCETDDDCPPGTVCGENGMCEPIGCMDDGDCPSGSRCAENGICEPVPCTSDEDCPPGSDCGEDGFCEPVPCDADEDCPPASTCEDGTCEPIPCTMDSDCPRGSTCGENGICIPTPCTSDEDCPEGSICDLESGQCVPEAECTMPGFAECRQDRRETCLDQTCVCTGDCDGDGKVFVDEVTRAVLILGGQRDVSFCPAADADGDGRVFVDEVTLAVINLGRDCPNGG